VNDGVRQKLSEIIKRYGHDICNEPKRCKGLLLDHCAGDRREVFVLVSALEEQVVTDLLAGLGGQSRDAVAGRLARRLVDRRALADDAARWAVESWALALGVSAESAIVPRPESRPSHGPTGRPADLITTRVGTVPLKLIQAGEFWMGSPDNDPEAFDDEKPRHKVRISESFYLGVTPVTQAQYKAVTGMSPSRFQARPKNPVESVSWYEVIRFCNRLSIKEGLTPYYAVRGSTRVRIVGGSGYRLPTEAEWEHACRAGTETRYYFGYREARLGEHAWYSANSEAQTRPVGRKHPNTFGLYDMHGNVWEWCWDGYDNDDPPGADGAGRRVLRGGGWGDRPQDLWSAMRYCYAPHARYDHLGFRIARGHSIP